MTRENHVKLRLFYFNASLQLLLISSQVGGTSTISEQRASFQNPSILSTQEEKKKKEKKKEKRKSHRRDFSFALIFLDDSIRFAGVRFSRICQPGERFSPGRSRKYFADCRTLTLLPSPSLMYW